LPIFLEISELPPDLTGAIVNSENTESSMIPRIAHMLNIIPFGQAHANVKIGPLQFGWYDNSSVCIRTVEKNKMKGKRINCPLCILCPN
jgi:hypothetical protein